MPRKVFISTLFTLLCLAQVAVANTVDFKPAHNYPVGTNPIAVIAGDFNDDGNRDLAVANSGDASIGDNGGVSVLMGIGDGTFQAQLNFTAGRNPSGMAGGDFNGDGKGDLVVVRAGDSSVGDNGDLTIFIGNGNGTFRKGAVLTPGRNPSSIATFDSNSDHKLDLAVTNSGVVSVLLGNGDGTFQPHVDYGSNLGSPVFVADFNLDGRADLVVGLFKNLSSLSVSILGGNGDGSFQAPAAVPATAGAYPGGYPVLLATGDMNGDGNEDLVARGPSHLCGTFPAIKSCPGPIGLFLGNGDFTFQTALPATISVESTSDLNGDGKLDLVGWAFVNQTRQSAVSLGNGEGSFQAPLTFATGANTTLGAIVAAIVDLNGDNAPELIATSPSDNAIAVLLNATGSDFSISVAPPTPNDLSPGENATAAISLSVLNAFNSPVSLACSVQPAQAGSPTCSLNSNSITFDSNGKASAILTITAGSRAASFHSLGFGRESTKAGMLWLPIAGFAFIGTGVGMGLSNRRCILAALIRVTLFFGLVSQLACGGGSGGSRSATYIVSITGTSGTAQHSTTTTLRVQ